MVVEKKQPDKDVQDIKKSLVRIDNTLNRQANQLEYHIKRTDELEAHLNNYDKKFEDLHINITKEIPMLLDIIKDANNNQTKTILKILVVGGTGITSIIGLLEFLMRLK